MSVASSLPRILIPIAVYSTFALARKCLPAKATIQSSGQIIDLRDESFSSIQWIVWFAIVVSIAGFAFATHAILIFLSKEYAALDGSAPFCLFPQAATWWFFPGFGALTLGYEIVLQLWSRFGDADQAARYDAWNSFKTGFDARKTLRWMALLIAAPIGILTVLEVPSHASLGDQVITDHGYGLSEAKTYRYDAVRRLTTIDGFRLKNGAVTRRAELSSILRMAGDGRLLKGEISRSSRIQPY